MYNNIEKIFQRYLNTEALKIIMLPSRESFEVELCKTGADIYVINNERSWDEKYDRPSNHFILPLSSINTELNYDLFIVPSMDYSKDTIHQVQSRLIIPTIIVDDKNSYQGKEVYGIAKNIPESSPDFLEYWSTIINNYTRI